jgi:transketolase
VNLEIIPYSEFERIKNLKSDLFFKLELISSMCRYNTLIMVKKAGSGHLGSSFSSMDLVVWLYYKELNILTEGINNPNRDIYFSSKGHDVPGLYSVLFSIGLLREDQILKLRRLGGLDGHPDTRTEGIETNSGSLGMGISKGKGMAWAKNKLHLNGQVYVVTGDGEFQEGQNFEALQSCVQQGVSNITVIMDHNKIQSDKPVTEIISLGDLYEKISTFGWHVVKMNGHDFSEMDRTFSALKKITNKPKFIIADTIKGKGVSFMEHPEALNRSNGLYPWHAGAPDDVSFTEASRELLFNINSKLEYIDCDAILTINTDFSNNISNYYSAQNLLGEPISEGAITKHKPANNSESIVDTYGKALVKAGENCKNLVVLDADLSSDCRLRYFENTFPEQFIENGIAEQDMVSMAGGLAKMGLLPVVNSFASFLASRANEQIYNNCTEKTKIIYACHYAGLIPAGPGKSHQSIRDISLLGALPNIEIIQPCNTIETEMVVDYCVNISKQNCVIRMNISPSPRDIRFPENYRLKAGRGVSLRSGSDAILFSYGPVMLNEALKASEILADEEFGLEVVNMPWLNRIDIDWLEKVICNHIKLFVLEDHAPVGGLGDFLMHQMMKHEILDTKELKIFAIEGFPACGTPIEAMHFHRIDGESLAIRIKSFMYEKQNYIQ